jgi:geranylgeranyl pyrophosphate synthase
VIDDLPCMDNSPTRRGRPTVHAAFGESTAVLTGFALVALAARTVVTGPMPAEIRARMLKFQLDLLGTLDCGELIAGQALDLDLAGRNREALRARMSELKTVPLFVLAIRAGCVSATPTHGEEALLDRFARHFGIAFQLADDIDDGESATADEFLQHVFLARESLQPFGERACELHESLDALCARARV